jgi:glycosyltransferase involved in cell wall biosynthesis
MDALGASIIANDRKEYAKGLPSMIAIVYPQFYGVGGIARYLDSFLKNLPEDHPCIYVITGNEYQTVRNYKNVNLIHIPFKSNRLALFFWTLKARGVLNQLYQQKKIKAYNLHIPPLISGLLLSKKIPMVLTAHTTYLGMSGQFYEREYFKSQWSRVEIACKRWLEQRIFNKAQAIVTLTTQGYQELQRYNIHCPIRVIPNGVDIGDFELSAPIEKSIDVLFCGRIEKRKGSRAMAEVCRALIDIQPDITICIVGYGDDDAWVKQQLQPYAQNVVLTGKVSFADMKAYYAKSKVYASTSYYEGLPGTCLEAMAMGLPAVVWDFLFYHDLVIPNKTGVLVQPNQTLQMAQSIVEIIEKKKTNPQHMSSVRQHIQQHFDWEKLSNNVLDVFEN